MEPSEFRRVLGHFPTGVTIVTSVCSDGRPCGLTVNAFCSVSLEPPLVLVCVEAGADSLCCIAEAGFFAVNVLPAERGESLSRRFAGPGAGEKKFTGVAYRSERTGAPVLETALAWLDCRVQDSFVAGDHTIFIGAVLEANAQDGQPLVYYRGGYGGFRP